MAEQSLHFLVIDSPETPDPGAVSCRRFAMDLGWLRSLGVRVVHCRPDDELATQLYLRLDYPAALPAVATNERWLAQGRYPSRAELAAILADDEAPLPAPDPHRAALHLLHCMACMANSGPAIAKVVPCPPSP